MTDEIILQETRWGGRYVLRVGGDEAELTFVREPGGVMRINHTEAPPAFRGQGVAARLVARAVADARAAGVKVAPSCSYAAAQFGKHPEWADLLAG